MIGYITAKPSVSRAFTDCLLKFASLYQVPFCVIRLENLLAYYEGASLRAQTWIDHSVIDSDGISLPSCLDTESAFFVDKYMPYYAPGFLTWLRNNCQILMQHSIPKYQLPALLTSNNMGLYAIPTWTVASYSDLFRLFPISKKLFLKPCSGRKGRGAIKARVDEYNTVYLENANGEHIVTEQLFNQLIKENAQSKLGKLYLAQPCFDFSLDSSHAVDFRLLRHRGANGDWEDVATYARIGASSLVSNVSQGGFIADAKETLSIIAGAKADALYEEIMHIGNTLPKLIQEQQDDPVFCLGLDIAIDHESLQPYILEANTYPGTKFHKYQLAEKRVQFYRYLANT